MNHLMTTAGLEVEGIEPVASGTNLVIGEVLSCEPHPDSDHLHAAGSFHAWLYINICLK